MARALADTLRDLLVLERTERELDDREQERAGLIEAIGTLDEELVEARARRDTLAGAVGLDLAELIDTLLDGVELRLVDREGAEVKSWGVEALVERLRRELSRVRS